MNATSFYNPTLTPGLPTGAPSPFNRVVSQPEPGITLIEPLAVEPLQYEAPDELGTEWAILSHSRMMSLTRHLKMVLAFDGPIKGIQVFRNPGGLPHISFGVRPEYLNMMIVPMNYPGLSITNVARTNIGFLWRVEGTNWPAWLLNN